jgi:hypothetical protein
MMSGKTARFSVFARFGLAAVVAISIEYLCHALEVDRAHDQLCLKRAHDKQPPRCCVGRRRTLIFDFAL